jgi:hypothetical protein
MNQSRYPRDMLVQAWLPAELPLRPMTADPFVEVL